MMSRRAAAVSPGLGRPASTLSRKLRRNGGRQGYRPSVADQAAWDRAERPKTCKLAGNLVLREHILEGLGLQWSPEHIAGWLRVEFPDDPEQWVFHATICLSLFVPSERLLNKELRKELRSGPGRDAPVEAASAGKAAGRSSTPCTSDRPAKADDRAVPRH